MRRGAAEPRALRPAASPAGDAAQGADRQLGGVACCQLHRLPIRRRRHANTVRERAGGAFCPLGCSKSRGSPGRPTGAHAVFQSSRALPGPLAGLADPVFGACTHHFGAVVTRPCPHSARGDMLTRGLWRSAGALGHLRVGGQPLKGRPALPQWPLRWAPSPRKGLGSQPQHRCLEGNCLRAASRCNGVRMKVSSPSNT